MTGATRGRSTASDYPKCGTCGAVLMARPFERDAVMQRHQQGHLDGAW